MFSSIITCIEVHLTAGTEYVIKCLAVVGASITTLSMEADGRVVGGGGEQKVACVLNSAASEVF